MWLVWRVNDVEDAVENQVEAEVGSLNHIFVCQSSIFATKIALVATENYNEK